MWTSCQGLWGCVHPPSPRTAPSAHGACPRTAPFAAELRKGALWLLPSAVRQIPCKTLHICPHLPQHNSGPSTRPTHRWYDFCLHSGFYFLACFELDSKHVKVWRFHTKQYQSSWQTGPALAPATVTGAEMQQPLQDTLAVHGPHWFISVICIPSLDPGIIWACDLTAETQLTDG